MIVKKSTIKSILIYFIRIDSNGEKEIRYSIEAKLRDGMKEVLKALQEGEEIIIED